jgi:predicted RNA-binding Zn-ribbon protein involved in translation (DUF1610 family)
MGLFDSVRVPCPNCGKLVEFQSKEGECYLNNYTLSDAPAEILCDIMNEPHYCQECGQWMALIDPKYPPGERPKPELRAAKVRAPENPTTHPQGFRWWPDDKSFTYDDLE